MVRHEVRAYQRRLAQLDADHSRTRDRLAGALRKRAEVLAEQDEFVAQAEKDVYAAIAAMAVAVGPDMTAALLDVEVAQVRRLLKATRHEDLDASQVEKGQSATTTCLKVRETASER